MHQFITTKKVNQTLWISLVNPPLNFLTTDMLAEVFQVFKEAKEDDSVRVVALTGGIEDTFIMHFSIPELARVAIDNEKWGMNLAAKSSLARAALGAIVGAGNRLMDACPAFESLQIKGAKLIRKQNSTLYLWLVMHRLIRFIERFPKITVAAINGPVNGGGVELSAAFDFRFMVSDQGFGLGQPEVLVGIIPGGGGSQRVPRLMGLPKALEWMLTGNLLTPKQGKELGLLTDAFPKKSFGKKVQDFCDLLSKRPPIAVAAVKKTVRLANETPIAKGLAHELVQSLLCFASKDAEKALEAYIKLINENLDVPQDQRISPDELFEIMTSARYVEPFLGK
jgi:enoyl-CoA hydratase/carnithine racemase